METAPPAMEVVAEVMASALGVGTDVSFGQRWLISPEFISPAEDFLARKTVPAKDGLR